MSGSMSYVTGSHNFKVGALFLQSYRDLYQPFERAISYTFAGRVPESVTYYASSAEREDAYPPDRALTHRNSGRSTGSRCTAACATTTTTAGIRRRTFRRARMSAPGTTTKFGTCRTGRTSTLAAASPRPVRQRAHRDQGEPRPLRGLRGQRWHRVREQPGQHDRDERHAGLDRQRRLRATGERAGAAVESELRAQRPDDEVFRTRCCAAGEIGATTGRAA